MQLDLITRLIEDKKIIPIIDKIYPLHQAQLALDYSASSRAKGKIILKIK